MDQSSRARKFRELHASGTFVIANAWDGGSARVLGSLGFAALATSSGAAAGVLGRLDHGITLEESLANARLICDSTDLPVSADLEKGFGDAPADTARAITRAAEVGLVGGSIEDATGVKDAPIFTLTLAAERIAAAVEAARALPFPFTLTARAENFLNGRADLDDTIQRLQAYERAGADVLFAPALPTLDAVRTVCSSLTKPVNFMVGIPGKSFSVAELAAAGVRRVSLATSLYRAAMTGLINAAREIRESGTFGYLDRMVTSAEFAGYLKKPTA
ncbi:MAG TPA: isocitrate lyase/phosphoenolpyruvate mutase family protein [Steroidobacteraceae bacterium]|jgi:2-methylisocitrate lyase-like PEP mutase family enzyme|nr:isocitrate lyase/phosphoenolpyruvate mutase family protein [Steroidobacteraceae bacterium]